MIILCAGGGLSAIYEIFYFHVAKALFQDTLNFEEVDLQ